MSSPVPDTLYYYCAAEAALENISDHSLQWITPAQLDGVTELNHDTQLRYSKKELTRAFVKIASSLVFASDAPKGESPLIKAIIRWREAERFDSHEEAESVLNDLCGKIVDQHLESFPLQAKRWRRACQQLHFVQLFSKYDNLSVWRHYADNFRGAVLALNINEESRFASSSQIRYSEYAPELSNLKEQVTCLLHGAQSHPERKITEKLILKAPDLKQQKEWRCFEQINEEANQENIDEQTPPEDWPKRIPLEEGGLKAIYLGPHIDSGIKEKILEQQSSKNLSTFQLRFAPGKFDLQSQKIED